MTKYETHIKEYTVIGITSVFWKFITDRFKGKLYNDQLSEILVIIKNGRFYHAEVENEIKNLAQSFLRKLNKGQINLAFEYANFDKQMRKYEKFLSQSQSQYTLNTLNTLYKFYDDLIGIAFTAAYGLDLARILEQKKYGNFKKWVMKTRKRAEPIYKRGETEFVPKYLTWLTKTHLKNYSADLLQYLFFKEFDNFIKLGKKLPSKKELANRKKALFISMTYPEKFILKTGVAAEKEIQKRKLFSEQTAKVSKITGQTAQPGKIIGKAAVILDRKDFGKFKTGDIIISQMTEPSFMPLMKQAKAFVTDDGGVLCHAAIVARELKKPCIIGTKIATKTFRDGDIIEVDATKGIVRKI